MPDITYKVINHNYVERTNDIYSIYMHPITIN
jgi:hypothetical protein